MSGLWRGKSYPFRQLLALPVKPVAVLSLPRVRGGNRPCTRWVISFRTTTADHLSLTGQLFSADFGTPSGFNRTRPPTQGSLLYQKMDLQMDHELGSMCAARF